MTFVHLATRSDQSVTSRPAIEDYPGSARVPQFVELASQLGQPAIAFTELGSMRGAYLQTVECDRHGIKPIYGVEVYVCANMKLGQLPKEVRDEILAVTDADDFRDAVDAKAAELGYTQSERELTTLNLWAFDDQGLRNLFAITSLAWIDGYYYKPRVDLELLSKYAEGVACGLGGSNSYVMRPLIEGRRGLALERANSLASIFGDRLYCEIRPHKLLTQSKVNAFAIELANSGVGKLLATQLAHYLAPGDLTHQKMLTAIVSGKGSDHESAGLPVDSFWLRSRDEMLEAFAACKVAPELSQRACDETLEFAARCTAKLAIDPFAMIMPEVDTGDLSHAERLRELVRGDRYYDICDAIFNYYAPRAKPTNTELWAMYNERLSHELDELERPVSEGSSATFASYILYVYEVVTMARELGVALGPGRGSAAGSLVNYLLGITDVDPIEHGLLFSRFIDPNRIGPPDIDIDCDPADRPKLIAAMRARWGSDRVAGIATIGKLKGRRVAEDVCRELRIPLAETKRITRWIDQRSDDAHDPFFTIRDAFTGPAANDECKNFAAQYPEFLAHAMGLEGVARSVGMHPAGIVAASRPLWEIVPLETRKDKDTDARVLVTAFEMHGVDQCGLLKIDLLGLKNITVIERAFAAINSSPQRSDDPISWDSIDLDDQATLDAFTAGDLAGVFQFDSSSARRVCAGVKFKRFLTVADILAVNRPGPLESGMAEKYLERIKGNGIVKIDYCLEVSELLADTFGVALYQEQVMMLAEKIGQHPNPDKLRKVMGKKLTTKIEAERDGFVSGALRTTGMTSEQANKLFDDLATFAEYGFNKSHSVAYAKIAFACQWLKVHYPLEFWWAMLTVFNDASETAKYARDARAHGVKLATPSVQSSGNSLMIDRKENAIVGALSDVRDVGDKAAESIMGAQPFASFADFMERVDRRLVNSKVIKALALSGALDSLLPNPRWFVENSDEIMHESKLKRFPGWDVALQPGNTAPQWSAAERLYHAELINPMNLESPYEDVLSSLAVELVEHGEGDDSIWAHDGKHVWVTGTLVDVRLFANKPYGSAPVSEAAQEHESYMAPEGVGTLVMESGAQIKSKAAWHVYRHATESFANDQRVIMLARVDAEYQTLRVALVVPLAPFITHEGLTIWHHILLGKVAPLDGLNLSDYRARIAKCNTSSLVQSLHAGSFDQLDLMGIVVNVQTKIAGRNQTEMAWVGLLTNDLDYYTITVFSSDWLGGYDRHARCQKVALSGFVKPGERVCMTVKSDSFRGEETLQALGAQEL